MSISTVINRQSVGKVDLRDEDELWKAVLSRDYRFYSSFVYAVTTSKIYCRPTCPSRKPSRERVFFYSETKNAREAGYRACLRCKPDETTALPENFQIIQRVCDFIEENYNSKIALANLANIARQSQFHFHRNFKEIMGITPKEYLEAVRLRHVKFSLKRGESAQRSTYRVGHSSSSWLYSDSKIGMSPADYKAGGTGLVICYSISNCSLGLLLVAGTDRGICFVCLGNSREMLLSHLKGEYPNAQISSEEKDRVKLWVSEILSYLEGKNHLGNLPVDVQATAFQWRVWKELQKIPYGGTMSYNEIAERIGNPRAYRAVANACGSNRVPLVIPCHRVVRKNGDLGGYRWGVERKKKLLKMEQISSK